MNQYPPLRDLHNSLVDENSEVRFVVMLHRVDAAIAALHDAKKSLHFSKHMAETVEKEWADKRKRKALSDDEQKSGTEKKKRSTRSERSSDEEQPGPSSQLIPASSLRKEETYAVWTSPIFKSQLPVTCGNLEGTLIKDRLAKGEKCILFQKEWFTPSEFERRAGRQSHRNWKTSIRYGCSPLKKFIQDGHLPSVKYKGGCKKDDKPLCPSAQAAADEEETEEETGQQEADHDGGYVVFKVLCDDVIFEAGADKVGAEVNRQPSILYSPAAAETSQLSPVELVKEASCQTARKTDVKLKETFKQLSNEDEKRQELSEDEEKCRGSDEQQPGPSSQLTSGQRNKSEKICFGEKCILYQNQWFTPNESERRAGKESSKNWKLSIRCDGSLIQDGHLASVKYKGGCKKASEPLCPPEQAVPDEEELVKEPSCEADASWRKDIEWKGKPLSVLIEKNVLTGHPGWKSPPDQEELENQRNDNECCVCKCDEPEPVPCVVCSRSFHRRCHLPHVEDADLRDDRPWMCTFCDFSQYSNSDEQEMRAAMSQHISRHTLKCHYLLLHLRCADEERTPALNPNGETSAVTQTAMSIRNIANKLQGQEYQTVEDFVSDIHLVFTTHAQNVQDGARSSRLQEIFDEEFKKVFNIR